MTSTKRSRTGSGCGWAKASRSMMCSWSDSRLPDHAQLRGSGLLRIKSQKNSSCQVVVDTKRQHQAVQRTQFAQQCVQFNAINRAVGDERAIQGPPSGRVASNKEHSCGTLGFWLGPGTAIKTYSMHRGKIREERRASITGEMCGEVCPMIQFQIGPA